MTALRAFGVIWCIVALAAGTACEQPVASTTTARPTVRIAWAPVAGSLPLFVARERGLFAAHGVDVETIEFTNSNDAVNALIAGQADLIPAVSLIPIVHLEIQHPGTLRIFSHSRSTPEHASDAIVTTAASPIHTIHDLAARRIGVFPGTSATNILRAFLERRAVKVDGITFVPLAPVAQLAALTSGSVDALFGYEPTTTVAREKGFRVVHGSVYASLLNPSPLGGAVIARAFERRAPEAARRVLMAFDDAVLVIRKEEAMVRTLLPQFLPVEPEIAKKLTIVPSGLSTENDVRSLQELIDLLRDVGEITSAVAAERLVRMAS